MRATTKKQIIAKFQPNYTDIIRIISRLFPVYSPKVSRWLIVHYYTQNDYQTQREGEQNDYQTRRKGEQNDYQIQREGEQNDYQTRREEEKNDYQIQRKEWDIFTPPPTPIYSFGKVTFCLTSGKRYVTHK